MANTNQNTVAQRDKDNRGVTFEVGGEAVTLTFGTVKNYIARGNEEVTDQEVVLFMNWCKYNLLNPWNNEAYLVKYDKTKPAQNITSKGAFMNRAEEHPEYDGFKAGLIVSRGNEIVEVEGSFTLKDDVILGGWAEVYRKDKKHPYSAKVNFEEYNKGQSTWKAMPRTMIRKVALVQALREAFPKNLSSLYTEEEIQDAVVIDEEQRVNEEIKNNANKKTVDFHKEQIIDIPIETETQAVYDAKTYKSKDTEDIGAQMGIEPDPGF